MCVCVREREIDRERERERERENTLGREHAFRQNSQASYASSLAYTNKTMKKTQKLQRKRAFQPS